MHALIIMIPQWRGQDYWIKSINVVYALIIFYVNDLGINSQLRETMVKLFAPVACTYQPHVHCAKAFT